MILDVIKSIFKPILKIIDKAVPDKDKKIELTHALAEVRIQFESKVLEYELKLMQTRASIITAEASGETYIQKAWRPWTMVMFGAIIAYNAVFVPIFNLPPSSMEGVPPEMWNLLTVGIGGYMGFRTIEKSIKIWKAK